MEGWQPFLLGVVGGIAFDFIPLYSFRWDEARPPWIKSWYFWITGLGMWIFGGGLAYLYHQQLSEFSPILALHVGASAPLLIRRLVGQGLDPAD